MKSSGSEPELTFFIHCWSHYWRISYVYSHLYSWHLNRTFRRTVAAKWTVTWVPARLVIMENMAAVSSRYPTYILKFDSKWKISLKFYLICYSMICHWWNESKFCLQNEQCLQNVNSVHPVDGTNNAMNITNSVVTSGSISNVSKHLWFLLMRCPSSATDLELAFSTSQVRARTFCSSWSVIIRSWQNCRTFSTPKEKLNWARV